MKNTELTGPRYWRSLDDLSETPAFKDWMEREFPAGASELQGVNRRHFMKIMAASFGLAGLGMAGCRRPEKLILPYSQQPENLIPGVPVYYTSSMPGERDNIPVIVETHTGRPTKIEGNPSFKSYGGGTSTFTQASILDLYDPDRSTKSSKDGVAVKPASVRDSLEAVRKAHLEDRGRGLVFLARTSASPSRAALVREIKQSFPEALWSEYTAIDSDTFDQASKAVFGKSLRALPKFSEVKRLLALDSDFLSTEDSSLSNVRDFMKTRKVKDSKDAKKMSRLYSVESTLTLTGSMADHRLRLSSGQMSAFVALLSIAVLKQKGISSPLFSQLKQVGASLEVDSKWIDACAADLVENAGHSLIVVGKHFPASVQALVMVLNDVLKAPINYVEVPEREQGIAEAVNRLNKGAVQTLIVLDGNPVYDAPANLNWSQAQSKAAQSIYLGSSLNETAEAVNLFIARSHYLESWGDGRTFDGTLVPVQPMIEPLFETFNELEILARIAGSSETDSYSISKRTFAELGGTDYNKFLSDGVLEGSSYPSVPVIVDYTAVVTLLKPNELLAPDFNIDKLEVRFIPNSHTYDGRYANNGWMLECPDPITKLTWDNAILLSPFLAKKLEAKYGVQIFPNKRPMNENSEFFEAAKGTQQINKAQFNRGKEQAVVAKLTVNGTSIEAPIHVVPGMADYTIALPLGMGRQKVGRVGQGVGFNAFTLRTSDGLSHTSDAVLELTGKTYQLANTQEHWSMEGRALIRENTAYGYSKNPDFANKMGVESHAPANYGHDKDKSLQEKSVNQYRGNSAYDHIPFKNPAPNVKVWKDNEDKFPVPQQWGMAIDMNSCIGCNACVVACQSENNIPIVGKDQVLRGREMHWIRIDRYFSAEKYDQSEVPDDVQVSFMSVLCQHCENAPCEQVCPVNATVHDSQGLNVMAYNRCVGTRYCANNCPYKVRRFNFFDWNKREVGKFYKGPLGPVDEPELEKMRANPNVTVRMRGVMEKCTYCTQRIEAAKIEQKRLAKDSGNIRVRDGAIKTACQQVCPTDGITFGDISDPDSEVSKMKASDRNYSVLGYLNVRPRTTYLARLRNPNPKMPDTYKKPYAYTQYKARYGHESHEADHGAAHHDEHKDHSTSKEASHAH